jgi:hypothetical protein
MLLFVENTKNGDFIILINMNLVVGLKDNKYRGIAAFLKIYITQKAIYKFFLHQFRILKWSLDLKYFS